jgi:hypothetical protein
MNNLKAAASIVFEKFDRGFCVSFLLNLFRQLNKFS